jgi:hypothetical protein
VLEHLDGHHEVERQRRERQMGNVGVDAEESSQPPLDGERVVVQVYADDVRFG